MDIKPEYIEKLKAIAKQKTWEDRDRESGEHFIAYDWCGGNFDDAYSGGCQTGTIEMARQVLTELGIDF